jgi:hypothetical protein
MVAQRIVDIEELGLHKTARCTDIPEWARISDVSLLFDPIKHKATLSYKRARTEDISTRQVIELVEC